jgi:preprotein translocase subunit SecY
MTSTLPRSHALWTRLLVTLAVVVVYRLGVWIPLPTIDPERLPQLLATAWAAFLVAGSRRGY